MVYLLDANVLMTAHNSYYPIDQIPEYWAWLRHHGSLGNIKIPKEMQEEVKKGSKKDTLFDWIRDTGTVKDLVFQEDADLLTVQRVVDDGYAKSLTDTEIEQIGRDPFLIAYAMMDMSAHVVVTLEVSAPSKIRHNRKIPDVCKTFGVECCTPFELNQRLKFSTAWNK
jgi:hypothetical protein